MTSEQPTTTDQRSPAEPHSRPRPSKWWALIVLAVGLAMIVMDGTIVAVSMPTIIDDLDLDLTDAQWVNSLYSVVLAALLLTAGSLGDRLGRRRLFIAGIALFVAGSIWAATAGDATALISARVLQGVGGACILPTTLSTVNDTFRGKDRAAAFGVWGAVISGAAALGPLLGGWLTSTFAWEWIFLVNVPIGVALVVAALIAVPETTAPSGRKGYDVDGLLLSFIGFGLLVFAIIEGSTLGWWKPLADLHLFGLTWSQDMPVSIVPILLGVAAVALVLFGFWERHRERVRRSALLDLNLFFIPTFSLGNIAAMMIAIGEFGLIFVLPLFLINAVGLGTMATGFVLATMALGAFVAGALARHLAALIGAAGTVLVGVALEVVGVLILALTIHSGTSPVLIGAILVIYGVGLGLASAQLTSTVLHDIPVSSSGQGSATQSTVRQVGAAIGAAIAGSVLSLGLAQSFASVTGPAAQFADATRSSAGGVISGLRAQGAPDAVVNVLASGFADATRWTLYSTTGFLVLGLLAAGAVWVAARRGGVGQEDMSVNAEAGATSV
ncbi:DHA2 family efflux MFS transporter permease subunit [Dietzia alimentaria]|uniref:DHA2 family efflux MFS transporter permease subunit n=1 Tax=Dietzia alimentaria TaxID=665550 RepID=UPI00029B030A|nr:DHA2 family efflux MFS transporter permease subunit [Dietzia alimentaria]